MLPLVEKSIVPLEAHSRNWQQWLPLEGQRGTRGQDGKKRSSIMYSFILLGFIPCVCNHFSKNNNLKSFASLGD